MEKKRFNVSMDVDVFNEEALFDAAYEHATDNGCGLSDHEAMELLRPSGELDVAAGVQMLLDPGVSPAGMQIENCTVDAC
jgi:hypothetical protein